MEIITRFAPSPTGLLHIGNTRTALINYLFAKKNGGKFMLRMDDTDTQRSKIEYEDQIKKDLEWLGLEWDIFAKQSDRLSRYDDVKNHLISISRLYPCFETEEEIEIKRKLLLSRGKPPIYDRAALSLSKDDIANFIANGKKPHYRFKLDHTKISWDDLVRGETIFEGDKLSDPIVIREDQTMTYILCSVIDDIDYKISHILRGEDHVSNTAVQIQMFEALNATIPVFGHTALIKTKDAEMSKRTGGFDIKSLNEKYIEPISLCTMVSKLGTSDDISPKSNLQTLINEFDIKKFGRSPANYDEQELFSLNHKTLSIIEYSQVSKKLPNSVTEDLWNAIRGNIYTIADVQTWIDVCFGEVNVLKEDKELLTKAIELLPNDNWNNSTWKEWTYKISEATSLKGKNLYMPIRKVITGKDHGPEMYMLLPIIGFSKVKKRLELSVL